MNEVRKNALALFIGIVLSFIICETILVVFHPFNYRVKANEIILPANQSFTMTNDYLPKLDSIIIHTRNSIGLRGEEPPERLEKHLSLITIGGSTTECYFLSDDNTWTAVLGKMLNKNFENIWINNAGLDGHSTFGHKILLESYIINLKPKIALFLTGANDIESHKLGDFDNLNVQRLNFNSFSVFVKSLCNYSETLGLAFNMYRYYLAYEKGLIHKQIDFPNLPTVEINEEGVNKALELQVPYLLTYKQRLVELIRICKSNQIIPVLITQPRLIGDEIDPSTKTNLGKMKCGNTTEKLRGRSWNCITMLYGT